MAPPIPTVSAGASTWRRAIWRAATRRVAEAGRRGGSTRRIDEAGPVDRRFIGRGGVHGS